MKIAPRLQALALIDPATNLSKDDWTLAEDWKGQRKELRALLAVARAAQKLSNESALNDSFEKWDPLDRALARLERASKVQP